MTLTEAAYWTRRLGLLAVVGVVLLVVIATLIIIFWGSDGGTEKYLQPDFACTETADEFYAEKLVIPSLKLDTASTETIIIETETGVADTLPPIANVYEYDNPGPSLIAQEKAKTIGENLGFPEESMRRRGTIEYYWEEDRYGRRLTINSNTLNFEFDTNFLNGNALPTERVLPTDEEAKQLATSFLRTNSWLLGDYSSEEPLVTEIDIQPDGTYAMAPSRAEAELLRVDFYRSKPFLMVRADHTDARAIKSELEEDYHGYNTSEETINTPNGKVDVYNFLAPVVFQNTQKSNISVYIGPKYQDRRNDVGGGLNIYGVEYTAWILQEDSCGTYPLLSASTVADQIEDGLASLVYLNETKGDTVVPYRPRQVSDLRVKQISLGYLDAPEKQKFLQPIYIVQGDAVLDNGVPGTFYFYLPAIDYENLQNRRVVQQNTQSDSGGGLF